MEGRGDERDLEGGAEADRDGSLMRGGGGGGGGEDGAGGAGRLARCASQSSLDECSQRPPPAPPAGPLHAARLLDALASLRKDKHLTDVCLLAVPENAEPAGEGEGPGEGERERVSVACGEGEGEPPGPAGEGTGEGEGVWAHRAVLAACSPYFRAMFTQFTERTRTTVTIQNVDRSALASIVEYMYEPDSLCVCETNVQALLSAASLLQVSGVRALCCGFLAGALAPDNALGIRAFADLHACDDLAAHAQRYIHQHFVEVTEGEEFLSLTADTLASLLDSDRLVVPSEEVVLDAVIRWMQHDPESRAGSLGSLLTHVRLGLVGQEALAARAQDEPLRSAGLHVKHLLLDALSLHVLNRQTARPRAGPRAPARLLAVGGQAPKAIRHVEAYCLDTGVWAPAADLPTRRCRAGLAIIDHKVYAIGGFNGTLRVRSVDIYDVLTDTWGTGPPLTARRSTLGVAVIGNKIYAVGGYDPLTDSWEGVCDMACRRSGAGVVSLGGCLYAAGGHDGPAVRRSVERFREGEGWCVAPPMTHARRNAGVVAHAGRIYVVGGDDGAANLPTVEVFDPATETWTVLAGAMSVGRSYAGVCVVSVPPA